MRKFIRHPSDIPIEVQMDKLAPRQMELLNNVSLFGLSFRSNVPLEKDSVIKIKIPFVKPAFTAKGKVIWCKKRASGYDIGVTFTTQKDSYKARMVEQVCHIEHYKKEVLEKEGRQLSGEEAAMEWIQKYAAKFPMIEELAS